MTIWVSSTAGLGALVHESIHAANFTLECVGVGADFKNDEAQAYLAQLIFEKALGK